MGRPEKPVIGDDPVARFARDLRETRAASGLTLRQLRQITGLSLSALSQLFAGKQLPPEQPLLKVLAACGIGDDRLQQWAHRRHEVNQLRAESRAATDTVTGFWVLGRVHVSVAGGAEVELSSTARTVLALLVLNLNRTVSVSQLAEGLRKDAFEDYDTAPRRVTVQVYVSRLRRALHEAGDETYQLVTVPGGYCLIADPNCVDLYRFTDKVRQARKKLEDGALAEASDLFHQALEEWSGTPLQGVEGLEPARKQLEDQRLAATEQSLKVDLQLGMHHDVAVTAGRLLDQYPFHEGLAGLRILALYRSGHAAAALELFQRMRQRLADELGMDPGPGLRDLYAAILNHDQSLAARAASVATSAWAWPRPSQLPRSGLLVGRDAELAELHRAAERDAGVTVLTGMAGAGKTALALHWASAAQDQFPDGQLFLDLHGTSSSPSLDPDEALLAMLQALGTSTDRIPPMLETRAALLRSIVAGRRILIVLDDAGSARQVRPLLPGHGPSRVIITSRHQLTELAVSHGAATIDIGPLPLEPACELLRQYVTRSGAPLPDGKTLTAVVKLCGQLPLALSIIGAQLVARPTRSLQDILQELTGDVPRLQTLTVGDVSVEEAISRSLATVSNRAARLLRHLAQAGSQTTDEISAAALTGDDLATIRHDLNELARASLLREVAPRHYRCHDLVRDVALHGRPKSEPPPMIRTAAGGSA